MPTKFWYALPVIAVALFSLKWSRSAPLQNQGAPAVGPTSFKIIFGDLQETEWAYSGSVAVTPGKVLHVTPWGSIAKTAAQTVGMFYGFSRQALFIGVFATSGPPERDSKLNFATEPS